MAPKPATMLAAMATKGPIPMPTAFKLVTSTRRSAAPEGLLDVGLDVLPPGLPDVVVVTLSPVPDGVGAPVEPVGEEEEDVKREAATAYNSELS